ncbi:hypothetical protein G9F73_005910 [Clostridium estertheticum]|uniref:hypothetical protein n=1 Tax=Clostridium estertheticum TaxID=238834 RepID=UPI0013EEB2BE|nr:hypothetical protein [Clostridium estertheticum]MBZ9607358.1 hypothetical protein [Clostridium estertheticum]
MQKRNDFLTFMSALVPGLGYMYLGLMKKGIQAMVIFFMVEPLFRFIGLGRLTSVIQIPLWFYLLFDTFNIAHKLDRGENVCDSDFIFSNYHNFNKKENLNNDTIESMKNKSGLIVGCALVIIGALSIINKLFGSNVIYDFIKQSIGIYFVPVLFIFVGVYLLVKPHQKK